jgi:hypothetical protein
VFLWWNLAFQTCNALVNSRLFSGPLFGHSMSVTLGRDAFAQRGYSIPARRPIDTLPYRKDNACL